MNGITKVEILDGQIVLVTQNMHWETGRDMARMIPGGRWNKSKKAWVYPLDYRICQEIRKATNHYESKLAIGPDLNQWALKEKARIASIPDPNSMDPVDIPVLKENFPKIWKAIESRPFQTVGVDFMAKRGAVCLADDPGLGKTLQTIATCVSRFPESGLFLVVAPKSAAKVTWPAEINLWSHGDTVVDLSSLADIPSAKRQSYYNKVADLIESPGRVWVITTPYWVQVKVKKKRNGEFDRGPDGKSPLQKTAKLPLLEEYEWDAIIVDESHKALICNTAKRSKHTQTRYGLDEIPLSDGGLKIAISGTPMRGKAENMWGTLNWLQPRFYTSYWKWMDRHFKAYADDSPFGSNTVYDGLKSEADFYDSMKECFIRRTKQEVASDLPSKMYGGEPLYDDGTGPIGVWLDMLPPQRKIYDQMVKQGETEDGIIANGILSEWTRLKQFANAACEMRDGTLRVTDQSNKLDWIFDFLEDRGIGDRTVTGNKVIIASQFSKFIDMLEWKLNRVGIETFKLTGATSAKERQRIQSEFQGNPDSPRVFLLTTTAGGVSLTLDAADDVVICDETWIPDDQLQVEDRAHRLSRTDHNVTIWYLRSRGTIEEAIATVTNGREDELRGIMDKSRGVDLIKKIKETM